VGGDTTVRGDKEVKMQHTGGKEEARKKFRDEEAAGGR
jgi:hypothetical protein